MVGRSDAWDEVLGAHLSFAARVYSPEELQRVANECGLELRLDGSNSAGSYDDVARYLAAVRAVLGETAFVSAKLTAMNKARMLGLRPPQARWFT
ncbi:MAG: hypothetical protein IT383_25430 [Deltaproteobacteria bacterium]|nr:hypothetical protein [Deltaproteobacteria bacterium]